MNGIDIRNTAGVRLVLQLDQVLTIEQAAGWLVDDQLPGGKSYPIKFPLEPNEQFLQSGYRPDSARPDMELVVTVRLVGVLYRRCLLNYRVTDGEGDGYLKIDAGEVWAKLGKLTLQEAIPDVLALGSSLLVPLPTRMAEIARMNPGDFPCTFFPIRNEGFFEDGIETKLTGFKKQPYLNAWGPLSGGGFGFLTDTSVVRGYPVSPQFYLAWVLTKIFSRAGYRLSGDWLGDAEVQRLVLINQTAIPVQRSGLINAGTHTAVVGQHLPRMSVGDFLKAIRQRFGLMYTFEANSQVATIRRFTDVVRSKANDLTPYIVGKYGIDAPGNRGYSVLDFVDSADELYRDERGNTIEPVPLLIGGNPANSDRDEVKLAAGTTQLIYEPSPFGTASLPVQWTVPTVRMPGNMLDVQYKTSDRYPEKDRSGALKLKNDVGLRIVSYRGLVAAQNGSLYPLGTPDARNGKQEIIGRSAASLTGRQGIWRQVLRQFYYFRDQTRSVTVPLDLPVAVVANLPLHEPIALKLASQARRTFLIEKLQAQSPGPSGLMECKLTCLTLPAGIELPGDADDAIVYVQWIAGPETGGGIAPRKVTRTYTVKMWADAAKTQPVVVSDLALLVRRKRNVDYDRLTDQFRSDYTETVLTYYLNGSTAVIETDFIVDEVRLVVNATGDVPNGLRQSLQPDPSDDYIILP